MKHSPYFPQAELLVRYLPALAAANCFALKGGTAINLFVRDMPRLSVDIDLAYTPRERRDQALEQIREALDHVADRARRIIPGLQVQYTGSRDAPKQVAWTSTARIKIEPNPVLRGTVFESEQRRLVPTAEVVFERSATVAVVSVPDLYAGKLCAALDRGHPRDWFDLALLMREEGIDDRLRQAFVVYAASHSRPMAELLAPRAALMNAFYEREFEGMARESVAFAELEEIAVKLPARVRNMLTDAERRFLLSIKQGEPDWSLLPIPHLQELPALQWKLRNIETLRRDPRKHADAVAKLRAVLDL